MSDDAKTSQLASVLRGEMIRRVAETIQLQQDNLDYKSSVKLSGSAVPYLLAGDHSVKIPNDIDFAVHTSDGLKPEHLAEEKIKMLVERSSKALGYRFKAIATTAGEEHCAIVTHSFTPEEVSRVAKASGLERALAANGIDTQALAQNIEVSLPVHFAFQSLSLFDAKEYEKAPAKKEGQLKPFKRDDMQDVLSVKLARVILGDDKDTPGTSVSDMLDAARILSDPKLRAEAMPDPELMRLLVVTRLAERIEPELKDSMRFSVSTDGEEGRKLTDAIRKKGYLVPSETDLAAAGQAVDTALAAIFPERQKQGDPLSEGEKQFLQSVLNPDSGKRSVDNIDMDLLVKGKPGNVFEKYPEMKERIHYSSSLNQAFDNHGARMEFY